MYLIVDSPKSINCVFILPGVPAWVFVLFSKTDLSRFLVLCVRIVHSGFKGLMVSRFRLRASQIKRCANVAILSQFLHVMVSESACCTIRKVPHAIEIAWSDHINDDKACDSRSLIYVLYVMEKSNCCCLSVMTEIYTNFPLKCFLLLMQLRFAHGISLHNDF